MVNKNSYFPLDVWFTELQFTPEDRSVLVGSKPASDVKISVIFSRAVKHIVHYFLLVFKCNPLLYNILSQNCNRYMISVTFQLLLPK